MARELNYIIGSDLKGSGSQKNNFNGRFAVDLMSAGVQTDHTETGKLRQFSTMQITVSPTDNELSTLPNIAGFILYQDKQDKNGKAMRIFRREDQTAPLLTDV